MILISLGFELLVLIIGHNGLTPNLVQLSHKGVASLKPPLRLQVLTNLLPPIRLEVVIDILVHINTLKINNVKTWRSLIARSSRTHRPRVAQESPESHPRVIQESPKSRILVERRLHSVWHSMIVCPMPHNSLACLYESKAF